MMLNIIYDDRRPEKYDSFLEQLRIQNIGHYKIWNCIVMNDVVKSINASHKMIVEDAKKQGLLFVVIAEDDILFTSDNSWQWFLSNIPPVYDLYTAGNYLPIENKKRGAVRVDCVVGFHLYIVHSRYYDTFLATKDDDHIDTAQKSKLMYCCYPFAAIQRAGWSANNKAICDYNKILQPQDLYR